MGLDCYIFMLNDDVTVTKLVDFHTITANYYSCDYGSEDQKGIYYFRRFYYLHHFMHTLNLKKGGHGDYNSFEVMFTKYDIVDLLTDILCHEKEYSHDSDWWGYKVLKIKKMCVNLIKLLNSGKRIYYTGNC